jgi:hypothetical protein
MFTDVYYERTASIFRVEEYVQQEMKQATGRITLKMEAVITANAPKRH